MRLELTYLRRRPVCPCAWYIERRRTGRKAPSKPCLPPRLPEAAVDVEVLEVFHDACFSLIAVVAGAPARAGGPACRGTNALKTSCIFISPAGIPSLTTTKVRVRS